MSDGAAMTELSYVKGESDAPLLDMTIGEALRRTAARHGTSDAIVSLHEHRRLAYADLDLAVDVAAKAFLAQGVGLGDRVAIWGANRADWLIAHHGAARIGAVVVTVNPAFRAEEVRHLLADSGTKVLVTAPGFRAFSYIEALNAIRAGLPELRTVVLWSREPVEGYVGWDRFVRSALNVSDEWLAAAITKVSCKDACSLQYTSGTTGRPKGALLTHHNILNNGAFVGARQLFSPADRICLPVPFFHCFGVVLGGMAAIAHGCALVLPGESFDPATTLQAAQAERCTVLYGVPMMFIAMLAHSEFATFDLSSLRTGVMGGAPCPLETMKQAVARMNMSQLTVCYGMTETSPISFQSLPDDDADTRVSTVGSVHPHVACKIVDFVTGAIVPRGQSGELCIRGYSVMQGYWRNRQATDDAIDAEGWMHSGDLASMRQDGYVAITGRIKDTIIRGGENIYPREIEEFLIRLPLIEEVYVFGVPDATYGEEVVAWVRPKQGHRLDIDAIREQCKGQIATYKIPKIFRVVQEFPTTASGKVQKFRMREMELAPLDSRTDS